MKATEYFPQQFAAEYDRLNVDRLQKRDDDRPDYVPVVVNQQLIGGKSTTGLYHNSSGHVDIAESELWQ